MNNEDLKKYWQTIEQLPFNGWDFSYMCNRWRQDELPWSYSRLVRENLSKEMDLLDMGTGGGELLLTFEHPYHQTTVTEGWRPNYRLLKETLQPLGVKVVFVAEDDQLKFPKDSFDIVLNSHESYDLTEVSRVLRPGGLFITQQVGDQNGRALSQKLFNNVQRQRIDWSLETAKKALLKENFDILFAAESFLAQHFLDMEGLIYYIKRIPWEYPNFSVETHFEALLDRQKELCEKGFISNQQHRFILVGKLMDL